MKKTKLIKTLFLTTCLCSTLGATLLFASNNAEAIVVNAEMPETAKFYDLLPADFPTIEDNAWWNENFAHMYYKKGAAKELWLHYGSQNYSILTNYDEALTKQGNNYCNKSGSVKFVLEGEKLVSIIISGQTGLGEDIKKINGTYAPYSTIATVLGTVTFPSTSGSAWATSDGNKIVYLNGGSIKFEVKNKGLFENL